MQRHSPNVLDVRWQRTIILKEVTNYGSALVDCLTVAFAGWSAYLGLSLLRLWSFRPSWSGIDYHPHSAAHRPPLKRTGSVSRKKNTRPLTPRGYSRPLLFGSEHGC